MSSGYDYDEDDDIGEDDDEALAGEDDDESFAERRRKRLKRTRGGGYNRPRKEGYVTQVQLQAALERVAKDVRQTSDNVKAIAARVEGVGKREKRDMAKMREMMFILPLLTRKSIALADAQKDTRVLIDSGDSMDLLLPMLLMGGLGGGGDSSSGDSSNMLVLLLALGGLGNRK